MGPGSGCLNGSCWHPLETVKGKTMRCFLKNESGRVVEWVVLVSVLVGMGFAVVTGIGGGIMGNADLRDGPSCVKPVGQEECL